MPQRHRIKTYISDAFYHAYNRGVEKRKIFLDDQDYRVFLNLLKYFLSPLESVSKNSHPLLNVQNIKYKRPRPLKNLHGEVELIAFCLMPNHFHLLIKQAAKDGMPRLMRKLLTTYALYFNKRYNRVGYLFQGRYKAAPVANDNYLLHLTRYIHLNPTELALAEKPLIAYPYSSYAYYLGEKNADWIKPDIVTKFFNNPHRFPGLIPYNNYKEFVEDHIVHPRDLIPHLTID